MTHTKRILALLLCCMLLSGCAMAAERTVTVTEEEYALLQKYRRLEEIRQMVGKSFLFEYDESDLLDSAAKGMLGGLDDPYSYYFTPIQMEEQTESFTGEYGGIGFEVFGSPTDQLITIRRVFYGSPAQQAGLLPGDKIIQVNGEDMTAYDLNKAVSMMRGEVGGEVKLTILRETEVFEVTCIRAVITTETITYEVLDNDIGYVMIHYFEGSLTSQFLRAQEEFMEKGIKGLIIDLRDNPGGLVSLAADIADAFLNEAVIVTAEDKYGRQLSYYANDGKWDIPVVIIMNEHSASASEILALALSDHGVAKTVGVKSFGKGIMQTVYTFPDDGAGLELTTDYWLGPNGACIHEIGIEPDVLVELAEDAKDENYALVPEKDNQRQAAIELLLTEIDARK